MVKYGDRPQLIMAQEMVTQNGWYIGTSRTHHNTHKKQRRILAERLRAKTLKHWAHPTVLPESRLLLQRLVRDPDRFTSIIKCFTVNVMLRTTFSRDSIPSLDNPLVHRINDVTDHQFISQIQGRFWVDYLPELQNLPAWLPGMGWKRQGLRWRHQADSLFLELWNETRLRSKEKTYGFPSLAQTLMETQMDQISLYEGMTISAAMVDAGTETLTGTSIVFIIIFMYFPHVLAKAQSVIDGAIGRDRLPTFDDISRIPYITAMIREAFRWRTVAPVAIPHSVVEDDFYEGYLIPKGATVFALSHYIHQDSKLYPDPDDFKPERFLDSAGQLNDLPHAGFGL
ncbi:hypothetical protein CABS02_08082 [Colletotrichum abscissum]|uniref:Cytochrome P450 n=1 Tax=Colletotrichum abscissum TaxID=1671311 RepID=A0A9Q0B3H8_9PEZI|nr:hypothetical protein CABS02_08082 [Colletotrichum abscissum]